MHTTYTGETGQDRYIARCFDCNWTGHRTDEHTANLEALAHHRKTGHAPRNHI